VRRKERGERRRRKNESAKDAGGKADEGRG
jgi:hypothetical protein